jgi:hypothetical protein
MDDVLVGPNVSHRVEPSAPRRERRLVPNTVVAASIAALVVTSVRLWVSRGRREYAIWPDEPSQLAVARFIGGGTRWNMYDHSVWRPLFGTLLAPIYLFTDDPGTVLRAGLVLNAVLGGAGAALLVLVARRLTAASPAQSAVVAVIVALVPGALFTTDFVFAESLVVPLYLATLLGLIAFQGSPSLWRGVAAGLAAGAAFAAHSRMLPLAFVVVAAAVVAAVRRRLAVRDAVAVVGVTGASVYLASAYTAYVVDRLWREPSTRNSIGGVLEQLGNGVAVLVSGLGQLWYLLVASVGVVAYGVVVLVRSAIGRSGSDLPKAADARVVLVAVGSCVALSVVFMSDRWRSDQLVYGRYNEAVIGPVLVVGLAALIGAVPLRRASAVVAGTVAAILASGSLLWALRSTELSDGNGLEPMILGLQPFMTSATSIEVVRISIWAAGLAGAVGAVAILGRRRRGGAVWLVVAVSALVLVGFVRTRTIIDRQWDDSGDVSAVEDLRSGPLVDGVPVDFHLPLGNTSTGRMMLYQFHLPRTEFTVVHDVGEQASSRFVFARLDVDGVEGSGARLVWRDPRGRYGLWER